MAQVVERVDGHAYLGTAGVDEESQVLVDKPTCKLHRRRRVAEKLRAPRRPSRVLEQEQENTEQGITLAVDALGHPNTPCLQLAIPITVYSIGPVLKQEPADVEATGENSALCRSAK